MAKTPPPGPLPTRIYVWEGDDADNPFLIADYTIDAAEAGETVGIYELKELRTKRITHDLG